MNWNLIKYGVTILICVALFPVLRQAQHYTLRVWSYLLGMHLPVPIVIYLLERKMNWHVHPVLVFVATWIGGIMLGYTVGPFIIKLMTK